LNAVYLELPLSFGLVALTLFLPGIWLLGWAVARRLFDDRLTAQVVSSGLALGAWTLSTHVLGLLTHSFSAALTLSSVGLGIAGAAQWRRDRPLTPLPRSPKKDRWEMLIFGVLLSIPIVVIARRWSFFDEIGPGGHQAMIANIQNGYYPPRSMSFPQLDLMYHYGFNLLCAMFTALFRASITTAIDAVTSLMWFYCALSSWLLGERMIGKGAGALMALVLLIGGGMPWTCSESVPQGVPLAFHLLAFCSEGGFTLNHNLVSFFFQHPWTLGLPLALTLLLVQNEESPAHPRLRLATLLVLFSALYLAQIALFMGLLGAVTASELLSRTGRPLAKRALSAGLILAVGVTNLVALGGFFAERGSNAGGLRFQLGITQDLGTSVWWVVKTFGLPLLGFVGFFWLPRRRLLFACLAAGGILVINAARYEFTGDIVKFATVASIGLAFPWAALLHRLRSSDKRAVAVWLHNILLTGTVVSSAAYLVVLALALPGVPGSFAYVQPRMTKDARAAASYLRRHMPHDAVMYRRESDYLSYTVYAGLPQVWMNPGFAADRRYGQERTALNSTLPNAAEPYLAQRVRFFVLDAADARLNPIADAWLAQGKAKLLGRFGALRVVELRPNKSGA